MSLTVRTSGVSTSIPGAYSSVTTVPNVGVNTAAMGIVHVIGECDGGAPGVHEFTDPNDVRDELVSGPLANAAHIALRTVSNATEIPGGASKVIAYKTNQSTQAATHVPGLSSDYLLASTDNGGTVLVPVWAAGGLTVNAHVGRWLRNNTIGEDRRIVSNTATHITVDRAFSSMAVGNVLRILKTQSVATSVGYGTAENTIRLELEAGVTARTYISTISKGSTTEQSGEICGSPYLRIMYRGGAIPANGSGTIQSVAANVFTVNVPGAVVGSAWQNMTFTIPTTGQQRKISDNTPWAGPGAGQVDVTVIATHVLTAAQIAAINAAPATFTFAVRNVTQANVSIGGANGAATTMTSAVLPTADNLAITYSTTNIYTLANLIDYLNNNTSYLATAGAGVDTSTTIMNTFDFGPTMATNVDCRYDSEVEDALIGAETAPTKRTRFFRDLQVYIDYVNANSTLITMARRTTDATEGAEIPKVTGGVSGTVGDVYLNLANGTRGTSTNTNWQDGFDALLTRAGNSVVALAVRDLSSEGYGSTATFTAIAAQLAAHVVLRRGIWRNEAGGYIGMRGTKAAIRAKARSFNDDDMHLFGQQWGVLDINGDVTVLDEWVCGVYAAAMRAGSNEVGEPLTNKSLLINSITQDATWDPQDITDQNDLTIDGVMFAYYTGSGYSWLRDRTTYVANANDDIRLDGNLSEEKRFLVRDFRQRLQDAFTGKKIANRTQRIPATMTSIKDISTAILEMYRDPPYRILTNSEDPEDPAPAGTRRIIEGFDRLRVSISGNTVYLTVRCVLAPGIVFILPDISVQVPTISA